MSNIVIQSANKQYSIIFGEDLSGVNTERSFFIIDRILVTNTWVQSLEVSKVIYVDGSETTKTIEYAAKLLEQLATLGATRKSQLVAVGGGSIQDVVTLCASLYMRGIPWIYVPSTYMSITDSCIGGKSAINVGNYKNLVGNFYPPDKIFVSESFLESLGPISISSGLCEAVKIQIAKSAKDFADFKSDYDLYCISGKSYHLMDIAKKSLITKKWFIEIDEFDQNERKLLNYGHSFGHALESASGMTIPHGLAIGIGMLVANSLVIENDYLRTVNQVIIEILQRSGFNFSSLNIDLGIFKNALKIDKKNTQKIQALILPNSKDSLELFESSIEDSKLERQTEALTNAILKVSA